MGTLLELCTITLIGSFVLSVKIPIKIWVYTPSWRIGRRSPCRGW